LIIFALRPLVSLSPPFRNPAIARVIAAVPHLQSIKNPFMSNNRTTFQQPNQRLFAFVILSQPFHFLDPCQRKRSLVKNCSSSQVRLQAFAR